MVRLHFPEAIHANHGLIAVVVPAVRMVPPSPPPPEMLRVANIHFSSSPQLSFVTPVPCGRPRRHTDKKENQIFLIYKEIQNGAVAKSYMTNGLLL